MEKKDNRLAVGLGIVVVASLLVAVLIQASGATTTHRSTTNSTNASAFEITPEMVVDTMGAAKEAKFCGAYNLVGDYEPNLAAFAEGYGTSQDPSAEEVFDELISRC